jgi:hypothetical protein
MGDNSCRLREGTCQSLGECSSPWSVGSSADGQGWGRLALALSQDRRQREKADAHGVDSRQQMKAA